MRYPNHVLNALYQRACADPELSLTIVTGLSIGKPRPSSDIERRFLEPFVERLFGNYPDLEYVAPYRKGNLPGNVEIVEFYMQAGTYLRSSAGTTASFNMNGSSSLTCPTTISFSPAAIRRCASASIERVSAFEDRL